MVAALYVDTRRGPYPDLLGDHNCWGLERDAKSYRGPDAVVAHPPCGPWGQLAHWCKHQDSTCGPIAVDQVRRYGGVLEHPHATRLKDHCNLPTPFWSVPLIAPHEWCLVVDQVRWGHPTRKRTLLFFCGVQPCDLPAMPPAREPTHFLGGRPDYRARMRELGRRRLDGERRFAARVTPVDFAVWLIEAVKRAESRRVAA